jgi:SET and MYND domain-containing protein
MAGEIEVGKSGIEHAGRGLFAKQDFAPGDIVVSLDRPYIAELDIDRLQDTCAWCFQRDARPVKDGLAGESKTVKACVGCKRVRYCSKTCQSRAWKREHKHECKVLAVPDRPDLPHGVRAVVKLLGRLQADPEGKDELLLDIIKFRPAADGTALERIKTEDPARFEDFGMLAYGAWKYAGEPQIGDMDSNAISKGFFFNIMSNTIQLHSPLDDMKLGIAFDPIICSANHSCEPNTVVVFNQPRILLRAIRPIKKGDEIFMKYVDVTNPFSVRQAELKESYFFSCKCAKCKKGAVWVEDKFLKPPEQLDATIAGVADNLIKRHANHLVKFFIPANDETAQKRVAAMQAEAFSVSGLTFDSNRGNDSASEDEIKDALKLTLNSGMWHITRQPVPHLLRQLLVCYLSQQRTYQAWRVGVKLYFEVAPFLHDQPFYPDRVIDTFMLAQVSNQLCNPNILHFRDIFQESMRAGLDLRVVYMGFLIETRENLDQSFGKTSPFGR